MLLSRVIFNYFPRETRKNQGFLVKSGDGGVKIVDRGKRNEKRNP
jgi:hypothetical protein